MHDGELDIDSDLVRRLLGAQFPEMADLPISAVESTGTVNAIYSAWRPAVHPTAARR